MNNILYLPLGELIRIKKGKKPLKISDRIYSNKHLPYLLIDSMEGQNKLFTDDSSCPLAKEEDTLLVWDGARSGFSSTGHCGYVGSTLALISNKSEIIDSRYLFYFIESKKNEIHYSSEGTGIPHVSRRFLENLQIPIPPLPEQKKISDTLSGIDNLIKSKQKKIYKLDQIRSSLTSTIDRFTKANKNGGLDIIKQSIPSDWRLVRFSDLLRIKMNGLYLADNEFYSPVIVRRRHLGVETRETKKSKEILVKKQFHACKGCFLISKRQVIHGSTGIVPEKLGRNPIISKEYLQLEPKNKDVLDIEFLNFYSRTALFHETIRMSVYGVDIEKYVFKENTWFNKFMLLPPIEEQIKISNSFISLEKTIFYLTIELNKFLNLKQAISSEVLSDQSRVKI